MGDVFSGQYSKYWEHYAQCKFEFGYADQVFTVLRALQQQPTCHLPLNIAAEVQLLSQLLSNELMFVQDSDFNFLFGIDLVENKYVTNYKPFRSIHRPLKLDSH